MDKRLGSILSIICKDKNLSARRVRILTQISKPMLLTTVLPCGLIGYKYSTKYGANNSCLFILTGLVYLIAFILSHSKLGLEKI